MERNKRLADVFSRAQLSIHKVYIAGSNYSETLSLLAVLKTV